MKTGKNAFTIIELLSVIAIIGKSAMAMVMYTMDNDGMLPAIGDHEQHATDWIYWHAGRDMRDSAIFHYRGAEYIPR